MPDILPSDTQWVILSLMARGNRLKPRPEPAKGSLAHWRRQTHDWYLDPDGDTVTRRTGEIMLSRGWIRQRKDGAYAITAAGVKAPKSRKAPRWLPFETGKRLGLHV